MDKLTTLDNLDTFKNELIKKYKLGGDVNVLYASDYSNSLHSAIENMKNGSRAIIICDNASNDVGITFHDGTEYHTGDIAFVEKMHYYASRGYVKKLGFMTNTPQVGDRGYYDDCNTTLNPEPITELKNWNEDKGIYNTITINGVDYDNYDEYNHLFVLKLSALYRDPRNFVFELGNEDTTKVVNKYYIQKDSLGYITSDDIYLNTNEIYDLIQNPSSYKNIGYSRKLYEEGCECNMLFLSFDGNYQQSTFEEQLKHFNLYKLDPENFTVGSSLYTLLDGPLEAITKSYSYTNKITYFDKIRQLDSNALTSDNFVLEGTTLTINL